MHLSFAWRPWLDDIRLKTVIWVALSYIVGARIGQLFSIEPGNVTPVWIPSGIMLALALRYGIGIWPGVFIGAFLGNIWAYLSFASIPALLAAVSSATLNGIGDVVSTVVAAQIIQFLLNSNRLLDSLRSLMVFLIIGVIAGPLMSAVFGVGGLWLFGHILSTEFTLVFFTWWIGDSVGALIFAPFLLSWLYPERFFDSRSILILILSMIYSLFTAAVAMDVIVLETHLRLLVFILVPLQFVVLFGSGQRLIFTIQLTVIAATVVATSLSFGPFASDNLWSSLIQLQTFAAAFSVMLFVIAVSNLQKTRNEQFLEKRSQELEELYRRDSLTGLWNRYRIKEFMEIELNRYEREKRPFGILLIDIDDFKKINDEHGHLEGDQVLTELSSLIKTHIREIDFIGRWGGEEFIIVVSNTSSEALTLFAKKLNSLVNLHPFESGYRVTISIGAALIREQDNDHTLLDRADEALYRAKNAGKNQVCFESE